MRCRPCWIQGSAGDPAAGEVYSTESRTLSVPRKPIVDAKKPSAGRPEAGKGEAERLLTNMLCAQG